MNLDKLDALYELYRFSLLPIDSDNLRAYSYTTRYFSNADLILLESNVPKEEVRKIEFEIKKLGFAVTIRNYKSIEDAETSLFDGFFDIANSIKLLKNNYKEYVRRINKVIFGEYEYINCQYYNYNNAKFETNNLIYNILQNFESDGPRLIVLEAAAGFGKTSTAYEVLHNLITQKDIQKIPLFAELSRSRQASIFKYVLYDEINRRFTGINLELVNKHIIEGRIPIIIDGFDELLKFRKDNAVEERFEDAEPMLETIKELLQGNAKILLTTRRTAIFAGDDFHSWIESNENQFSFHRYSLSSPTVTDWIDKSREKAIQKAGLDLKAISNPVLLSYIRGIEEERFSSEETLNVDIIIEEYIKKLMERENERQDLIMTVAEQKTILKHVASYFIQQDITSAAKEELEKLIFAKEEMLLYSVTDRYSSSTRPTIDQLTTKLVMHAFLDRKGDIEQQIGFVNDFILGTFCGENLLENNDDGWICTDRFIDFIITAYSPRKEEIKIKIYNFLNKNILDITPIEKQVYVDAALKGEINRKLNGAFIENLTFYDNFNGQYEVIDTIFSNCEFFDIIFNWDKIKGIFFINCTFYDCDFNFAEYNENISFTNCNSNTPLITIRFEEKIDIDENDLDEIDMYEKHVLERFWPTGKERFSPHKRENTLKMGHSYVEYPLLDEAINSLVKKEVLIKRKGQDAIELNITKLNEIKKILGRI